MKYLKTFLLSFCLILLHNICEGQSFKSEKLINNAGEYELRLNQLKLQMGSSSIEQMQMNQNNDFSVLNINGNLNRRKINLEDEIIGLIAFNALTAVVIGAGYATGGIDDFPFVLVGLDLVVSGVLTWKMFGGPFN